MAPDGPGGINQLKETFTHLSFPQTERHSNLSALVLIYVHRCEMCLIMSVLEYNIALSLPPLYSHDNGGFRLLIDGSDPSA